MDSTGSRLRVATIIDGLGWGGAEMLLADLAAGAAANDIDMSVAYLKDKDGSPAAARLRRAGVEPVNLDIDLLRQPSAIPRLRRHLRHARPDVVHTHLAYSDLLGGAAARSLSLPAVSTLHVMRWDGLGRDRLKEPLYAAARRGCARRVVTVSDAARDAYLATGRDVPDRVVTVRNGIMGQDRAGAGPRVRQELGIRADEIVVAMVAVLRPGKGHDVAMDAMQRLRRDHPDTRLLILGDGPIKSEVMGRARQLGEAVTFTGHRDDVLDVLDATDIVVHPTAYDAFPTALLEAMCARVPAIATAVGGIPEIVEDGVTGLTLDAPPSASDLEAALRRLLQAPGERLALGRAAGERFREEFTAKRWGERLRGLYQSVLHE